MLQGRDGSIPRDGLVRLCCPHRYPGSYAVAVNVANGFESFVTPMQTQVWPVLLLPHCFSCPPP